MTLTVEPERWGGLLFFRPETGVVDGREVPGTVAGCPGCGWTGAPSIGTGTEEHGGPLLTGERSTWCPACESEGTAPGDRELRVAGPEDVCGGGPWARLTRRGELGELYRPRRGRAAFRREQLGTVTRIGVKVGRNDPCPCDSGRKWKKCCGVAA